jgi:hypothetical protein
MQRLVLAVAALMMLALAFPAKTTADDPQNDQVGTPLRAILTGYQEVPAVSTKGVGEFRARLSDDKTKIDYTLEWKDLEGTTITKANLHFGQVSVTGDVLALLCGPNSQTAVCGDPASGKIQGSIAATDIVGPLPQGIDPAETTVFEEVLRAMRTGNTYVNIYTDKFAAGEIRGQILTRRFGLFDAAVEARKPK